MRCRHSCTQDAMHLAIASCGWHALMILRMQTLLHTGAPAPRKQTGGTHRAGGRRVGCWEVPVPVPAPSASSKPAVGTSAAAWREYGWSLSVQEPRKWGCHPAKVPHSVHTNCFQQTMQGPAPVFIHSTAAGLLYLCAAPAPATDLSCRVCASRGLPHFVRTRPCKPKTRATHTASGKHLRHSNGKQQAPVPLTRQAASTSATYTVSSKHTRHSHGVW